MVADAPISPANLTKGPCSAANFQSGGISAFVIIVTLGGCGGECSFYQLQNKIIISTNASNNLRLERS